MNEHAAGVSWQRLRRVALGLAASAMAVTAVHAKSNPSIVVMPPAALPEQARQSGEALFLHESIDGRTILYVEQRLGAQLASFDVTDPGHIKSEGSQPLPAPGPYDYVTAAGDDGYLVRYRQGQGDAILNLHRTATLTNVPGLESSATPAGSQRAAYAEAVIANVPEFTRVLDPNRIRAAITKADTGTTFVLADNGLYVIRQPATEAVHQLMAVAPN